MWIQVHLEVGQKGLYYSEKCVAILFLYAGNKTSFCIKWLRFFRYSKRKKDINATGSTL